MESGRSRRFRLVMCASLYVVQGIGLPYFRKAPEIAGRQQRSHPMTER